MVRGLALIQAFVDVIGLGEDQRSSFRLFTDPLIIRDVIEDSTVLDPFIPESDKNSSSVFRAWERFVFIIGALLIGTRTLFDIKDHLVHACVAIVV